MNSFVNRRANLLRDAKADGSDAFLITEPTNVRYLSGFTGSSALLYLSAKHSVILSDGRYAQQLEEECPELEAHIRPQDVSQWADVASFLSIHGPATVAVEADHITIALHEHLRANAAGAVLQPLSGRVERLRATKDAGEIQAIREAIAVAERAFKMFAACITPRHTEIELANDMEHFLRQAGAVKSAFDPIVAIGERSALPHAKPTVRPVQDSAKLLVDWGADCGYRSDLTRTLKLPFPITPTRRSRTERLGYDFDRIYSAVLAGHDAAVRELRAGALVKDVDGAARAALTRHSPKGIDLATMFTHGLGHGLGLATHEAPFLRQSSDASLEVGHVVTIEPGVYLPGWGGIRIEDDYLITRDGAIRLTTLPHDPDALA